MQFIITDGNQPLTMHLCHHFIELCRQFILTPAQEQLRFQHWVDGLNMAQQLLTRNTAVLGNNGRHQRRQHQHVRDVIAVVGHQHGLLARQNDDVTNRIFLDFELVHLQRVIDQFAGGGRRHGRIHGIRHVAHDIQVAINLLGQLLTGQ